MVTNRFDVLRMGKRLSFETRVFHSKTVDSVRKQCRLLKKYLNTDNEKTKNSIMQNLNSNVLDMIDLFGVAGTLARLNMAIAKDKFRPRDLPIYEFATSDELMNVGGNFSTFDATLSKIMRQRNDDDYARMYIEDSVPNVVEMVQEYQSLFERAMAANKQLCDVAIECGPHGDIMVWNQFFVEIGKYMLNKTKGTNDIDLGVAIVDSMGQLPEYVRNARPDLCANKSDVFGLHFSLTLQVVKKKKTQIFARLYFD